MSNILKTIEYLKKNPENRFLMLTNLENNQKVGKAAIYLDDIPGEDLNNYIKTSLGDVAKTTLVWVELRVKQGATSRKEDAYKVQIDPVIVEPVNMLPAVQPVPHYQPAQAAPQPDFFGTGLGQSYGLGQIIDMHTKANRLTDKEEALAELKEEYKELKRQNNILDDANRELKTKLSTSEAKQEMAVMMVKAENKSFFDSPAFEKMMDKAPELLSGIVAMKTGGAATGSLGANLSETHTELIDYISNNLTEHQANYIGSICGLMTNEAFAQDLNSLITQYATV